MAVAVNVQQDELLVKFKKMLIIFNEQKEQTDGQNSGVDLRGALGEARLSLRLSLR